MNKLSKQKRQQLVLVVLATLGVLIGLWLGLVQNQRQGLRHLAEKKTATEHKLKEMKQAIGNATRVETRLAEAGNELARVEDTMASGDLYSWTFNTIRQFKLSHQVDIPQFSQVDGPKDVTLLARFPYKQISISVSGTALFQDFGRFVADFENQFPYARLLNLNLQPAPTTASSDQEKLLFKMEMVALVKPGAS